MRPVFIPILFLLTSCSMKYGVLVGGQRETHKETYRKTLDGSSDGIRVPDFIGKGEGYHFGISEESAHFVTKMFYYHNTYPEQEYTTAGTKYKTNLKEKGFATTLALKMWIFQPFVGFKTYNTILTIDKDSVKDNYSIFTYGLNVEIPLSRHLRVYAGYSLNKKKTNTYENMMKLDLEKSHKQLSAGLRWNFGAVKAISADATPKE
ncbi:hypothetical protein [Bacteriovorax sp. Seq25_V]|uniref:hypothetical protein n=1 Tax=Bacteriovorax sp. Seq25_V TaxID=1201288 RepID=UPI000389FA80|nr:hypothetical protein [Bacteriovorax sp. Seq25_V]EQC47596.1 putative lipoprotein [Bacteriovorax sp. Seq25_V]